LLFIVCPPFIRGGLIYLYFDYFGDFELWPITLSLAGIAGYLLSIGMAVDANVLIFERMREEIRLGKPLGTAIEEGFKRAWLSIRDSNASSLITCLILFWFGSSIIQGFAITLGIGILVSMFSAITITRTLLRLIVKRSLNDRLWLFNVKIEEKKNV
jgi:preprotein translocase subunit SecD